jgi:protein-L-isoaspartate(D-aspartate) O-methyltransferase
MKRQLIAIIIVLFAVVTIALTLVNIASVRRTAAPSARRPAAPAEPDRQPEAAQSSPTLMPPTKRTMIEQHLKGRDITDPRVLEAMAAVPREEFVEPSQREAAYGDHPLPIGHGQTISQPYIVALMTQLAQPAPEDKALDVGTGSGYQAAVLAELCDQVYGIEIVEPLAELAGQRLKRLGYENVTVRTGDGYRGWPEHAPFDVIILAAAPDHVPEPLVEQLAPGGRLVLPVGDMFQELVVIEKQPDGSTTRRTIAAVAFVPMTGEARP